MIKYVTLSALLATQTLSFATPSSISSTTQAANTPVEDIAAKLPELSAKSQQLNPEVLKLALDAYNCASLTSPNKKPNLTIIDYSLPSSEKRMWIFDIANNKLLFNSLVAHGQGSGQATAARFSNQPETHATSLGLFKTGEVYNGRNGYSMRLHGLENGFNDKAAARSIVVHGAPYVNEAQAAKTGRVGRSWGCPAVPKQLAQPIINTIKDGNLVFAYYPDSKWLKESKYINCSGNLPLYTANKVKTNEIRA